MPNILVLVKQVPDTTEIKTDPVTNTLIRTGVPSIVNPYDAYALETAVRIKEALGGSVTVLSMGPPQAKEALKQCLSVGADQAILLTDRAFGGSDTLATSRILAAAVHQLGSFDLVLCGKQAIDGDTAQVGPETAENLGYAQITCAADVTIVDGKARVRRDTDDGYVVLETALPALVTVNTCTGEPRMATIRSKMAASRATIREMTAAELPLEPVQMGLKGSATRVIKTYVPVRNSHCEKIAGEDPRAAAKTLFDRLDAVNCL